MITERKYKLCLLVSDFNGLPSAGYTSYFTNKVENITSKDDFKNFISELEDYNTTGKDNFSNKDLINNAYLTFLTNPNVKEEDRQDIINYGNLNGQESLIRSIKSGRKSLIGAYNNYSPPSNPLGAFDYSQLQPLQPKKSYDFLGRDFSKANFYEDALKYSLDKAFGDQLFSLALGDANVSLTDKNLIFQTALDSLGVTRASTYQSAFNSGSFNTSNILDKIAKDNSLNSLDLTSLYKTNKDLLTKDERSTLKAQRNKVEDAEWESSGLKALYEAKLSTGSKLAGTIADGVDSLLAKNKKVANLSDFTQGANKAYDATSTALMSSGNPYAMMAGAIMKANGFVVDGLTAMGIGTDQMTTLDKILDSKWLKMTPTGLVNASFAKKSDSFAVDTDTLAAQGSAYAGSYIGIEKAANRAGKKYGLLSSGSRRRANKYIAELREILDLILTINENAEDLASMGSYYGNAYKTYNDLNGGYNDIQIGLLGMKIEKAKQTLKNRKQVDPSKEYPTQDPLDEDKLFNFFMTTMPVSVRPKEGSTFAMKNFWELSGKPLTFNNAIQSGMYLLQEDEDDPETLSWQPNPYVVDKETGDTLLMIKEDDPNYNKVLKRLLNGFNKVEPTTGGYNRIVKVDRHPEAKDDKDYAAFTETLPNNLKPREDSSYDMYRYWVLMGRPKDFNEGIDRNMFSEVTDNNGTFYHAGSVARNPETGNYEFMKHSSHPNHYMELAWYNSNDPKAKAFKNEYEYVPGADGWDLYIKRAQPLDPNIPVEEFKEGGKVNVIPTGALHARLNHMDVEDITHKGIPVITEEKGGIVQHAEIERDEFIFNLDVTKKLEELAKKYAEEQKDEYAIEAGKLLAKEIMTNTEDNTGLIEKVTGNENNEN